jgi:uncharacterized integral membrane protein
MRKLTEPLSKAMMMYPRSKGLAELVPPHPGKGIPITRSCGKAHKSGTPDSPAQKLPARECCRFCGHPPAIGKGMKTIKHYGMVFAIVLGSVVLLQNMQSVETRFLFFKITMPNAILLGLTLLVGFAIGYLLALIRSSHRGD